MVIIPWWEKRERMRQDTEYPIPDLLLLSNQGQSQTLGMQKNLCYSWCDENYILAKESLFTARFAYCAGTGEIM